MQLTLFVWKSTKTCERRLISNVFTGIKFSLLIELKDILSNPKSSFKYNLFLFKGIAINLKTQDSKICSFMGLVAPS